MQKIGTQLRSLREQRGLTAAEVAQRTGISQNSISLLERDGTMNPGFETLVRLGAAYDLSPDTLASMAGLAGRDGAEAEVPDRVLRVVQSLLRLPEDRQDLALTVLERFVAGEHADMRRAAKST